MRKNDYVGGGVVSSPTNSVVGGWPQILLKSNIRIYMLNTTWIGLQLANIALVENDLYFEGATFAIRNMSAQPYQVGFFTRIGVDYFVNVPIGQTKQFTYNKLLDIWS
jgi:hypothetical protein